MTLKVYVDEEKCIGCGACVAVSDNFKMKGDKAIVVDELSETSDNKEAAEICPTQAILFADST